MTLPSHRHSVFLSLAGLLLGPIVVSLGPGAPATAAPAQVDFARSVRPLLERRCYACHGATQQKGGLRLHRKVDAFAGGDGGLVLVPGNGKASRLVQYVAGEVKDHRMPPAGAPLTTDEVQLLRTWVDQGAPWPDDATEADHAPAHWSFRPVTDPVPPRVHSKGWIRNPIDAFILAKLEAKGLHPSPPADRVTLIRRVSLDLTGLLPTPQEVDAFLRDARPGAYERVVDRLLASPAYGERWARPWLDLARYADSDGYTIDGPREVWPYRDWVIQALNEDMPFDRFTVEQLAGDLLPKPTPEQLIATGFHRNTLFNAEGGIDPEQFRVERVVDRVNTTGSVWLGLTVGCAQCHSHKFDPITQREYYQLFAFFNDQDETIYVRGSSEEITRLQAVRTEISRVKEQIKKDGAAAGPADRKRSELKLQQLEQEQKQLGEKVASCLIMHERPTPRDSYVFLRGDFLRHGIRVEPGIPSVLPPLQPAGKRPNRLDLARWLVDGRNPLTARVTVNRIWQSYFGHGIVETENDFGTQGEAPTHPELLDWLASAFVAGAGERGPGVGVQGSEATGIGRSKTKAGTPVKHTPAPGFGSVPSPAPGPRASAPVQAWSLKALHRLIVTSATYCQSSRYRPDLAAVDPANRLLGRQNRLRLDAEGIRDAALTASGLLSRKLGGPSVFPPQPPGTEVLTQVKRVWTPSTGEDRYRRGLYTWHWRSNPYPLFVTFDGPNRTATCTRRMRSDTPTQALMLANDASLFELAQGLAARVLREAPTSDADRLRVAYRLCLAREPSAAERERLLAYLAAQRKAFASDPSAAKEAAPGELTRGATTPEGAAWTATARVLLNLDEFITRE